MSGTRKVILVLLFGIIGFAALLAVVVAGGVFFWFTSTEEPVTAQDREVILDINALADWVEDFDPDLSRESTKKIRYIDRSVDIEYEYDDPSDEAPYLNCSVTYEPKLSDASTSYHALWNGSKIGIAMSGESDVKVVERNEVFKWGDQSKFAVLQADGIPAGNIFITRKGNHVFYITFGGVYFDDPASISELLTPVLSRLTSYKP